MLYVLYLGHIGRLYFLAVIYFDEINWLAGHSHRSAGVNIDQFDVTNNYFTV